MPYEPPGGGFQVPDSPVCRNIVPEPPEQVDLAQTIRVERHALAPALGLRLLIPGSGFTPRPLTCWAILHVSLNLSEFVSSPVKLR